LKHLEVKAKQRQIRVLGCDTNCNGLSTFANDMPEL